MRMRRKKNLETRLGDCSEILIDCENEDLNFENAAPADSVLNLKELFGNGNPLVLEIGCGKGGFACEFAKRNPDLNIIAVEKVGNVIVAACEAARQAELKNIKFMKCNAEYLPCYIPAGSVSALYLNFSCPFPKKKYAKHRLTHPNFLKIYKQLLAPDAPICQSFSQSGFKLSNISLDLHASDFEGNIVTEYEKRFSDMGMPIYRLEARL